MNKAVVYNTGNIDKYKSGNPLKQLLVKRFDQQLLGLLEDVDKTNKNSGGWSLLDAGCGEGIITNLIKNRFPEWSITGLDGAPEAVDIASQMHPDINFQVGNLYGLPFPDGCFDVVLCSEVLEHLAEPHRGMEELQRITGKMLLLTVPHEPWFRLGNLLSCHNISRLGNPEDHINHWSFASFQKFTGNILTDFDCIYSKSFPWSICKAVRKK